MKKEDVKVTCEKGNFLNEEQAKVKGKIMRGLFHALYAEMDFYKDIFNNQQLTDVVVSCLIMFTRDLLVDLFLNSDYSMSKNEIMDAVFFNIKSEVHRRIAEEKDKAH